ncbi:MAG: hypothetical protein JSS96_07440 [Bacteroidetes bacterium]|nr:hypothetical protein [Bacteroidota bacterium]
MRLKVIDNIEAQKIILNEGLDLQKDVWHFTFNEQFNDREYLFDKVNKVVFSKPVNQWAPLLVYSRQQDEVINEQNFVTQVPFNKENKDYRKVFWYLATTNFETFLQRRSESSEQPQKNFPSLQTYSKKRAALDNLRLEVNEFDMNFYSYHFNRLKQAGHMSAEEIFKVTISDVKNLPLIWVKLGCLYHEQELRAIMLLVDDKRAMCYANMATERSKYGYGLWLCTEIVKYCCDNNYKSFDSGISGLYGNFKEKIYLDSREIYKKSSESSLKYVEFWKKKFWQRVYNKVAG